MRLIPGDVIDLQEKWCEGQNGSISQVNEIKVFFLVPCLSVVSRKDVFLQVSKW